ncbi:MAG: aminotransferase class V-fold PLP-dependent enzyme [Microscillaceae bacterium]|nr:aminotransferase class V-fold PLP-dependent enzyme [Microscillaceae bacterium]
MSPSLHSVQEAGILGMAKQKLPYQFSPDDFFKPTEELRKIFARIIGCTEPERIVVIPSTSYAMANIANNLKIHPGENIVLIGEQFPSNVYPWRRLSANKNVILKTVSPPKENFERGKRWNEAILEAIDSQTRMISMGHVHWADGTCFDLKAIRKRSREVGALLVVDGTQSVGALPFDLADIEADALVCAGYKWLLGPYSMGLAYFGEYFDEGTPIEENWMNRLKSENFGALI